jgi:hypothetical protein
MANLTITAANVVASAGAVIRTGTAGATVTAGQSVYLDSADQKYKLLDADALPSGGVSAVYLTLNGAANNQPVTVLRSGDVTLGPTVMTAGTTYCVADTAGAIAPQADLTTGDSVIVLGVAKSASVLAFRPIISGVTL